MHHTKWIAVLAGAGLLMALLPRVTAADPSTTMCTGTLSAGTYQDVEVPAGDTCTLSAGVTINHDLTVDQGASLIDFAASVGHDIAANRPNVIQIHGTNGGGSGSVGHDIQIDGTTGSGNYICNTVVNHDLVVQNGASGADYQIGGPSNCLYRANAVGHDLVDQNNKGVQDIDCNGSAMGGSNPTCPGTAGVTATSASPIGHDLTVQGNTGGTTVDNNSATHDVTCQNDSPGSGAGNSAGHSDSCNRSF